MPGQTFRFDFGALESTFAFIEMMTEVVNSDFPGFSVTPHPDAPDNNGRHWRGLRATITGMDKGISLYTHSGLVYHPDTRAGIYLEVDKKNNLPVYQAVWDNIVLDEAYDLCKDEPDYLKLFYPDSKLKLLMGGKTLQEQQALYRVYYERAITNLLKAARG